MYNDNKLLKEEKDVKRWTWACGGLFKNFSN